MPICTERRKKTIVGIVIGSLGLIAVLMIVRVKPDRVVFGFYSGECVTNCGTMYQVEATSIVIDSNSFWKTYTADRFEIQGRRYTAPDEQRGYEHLKLAIPLIMLLEPRTRIGCPDCHDQGGLFVEFTLAGMKRRFFIDPNNPPVYYPGLKDDIVSHVDEMKSALTPSLR
jgi:hypothetical protein